MIKQGLSMLTTLLMISPLFIFSQTSTAGKDAVGLKEAWHQKARYFHDQYFQSGGSEKLNMLDSAIFYFKLSKSKNEVVEFMIYKCSILYTDNDWTAYVQAAKDLEIAVEQLNENDSYYPAAMNVLATYYESKGELNNAIRFYHAALNIDTEKADPRGLVVCSINLGNLYFNKGEFGEAGKFVDRAINISRTIERPKFYQLKNALKQAALIEFELGNYTKALNCHQESNALMANSNSKYDQQIVLYNLQGIARIKLMQNKLADAEDVIEKSINLAEKKELGFDCHKSYLLLGELKLKNRKYDTAMRAFEMALEKATQQFDVFSRHKEIALCHLAIGNTLAVSGRKEDALKSYQRALLHATKKFVPLNDWQNPDKKEFIYSLDGVRIVEQKAHLFFEWYKEQKDTSYLSNAYHTAVLGTGLVQLTRKGYFSNLAKLKLGAVSESIFDMAIAICHEMHRVTGKKYYLEKVFELSEQNKARIFLESINEYDALQTGVIPQELVKEEKNLRGELTYSRELLALEQQKEAPGQDRLNVLENSFFYLDEKYRIFIEELEKKYPGYEQLKQLDDLGKLKEIQQDILDDKTVMLTYHLGASTVYGILVTKNNLQVEHLGRSAKLIDHLEPILNYLKTTPDTDQQKYMSYVTEANHLYRIIFHPFLANIPPETRRLLVVPDQELALLPFGALISEVPQNTSEAHPKSLNYLINQYDICYALSATFLLNDRLKNERRKNKKKLLAFAPSFDESIAGEVRNCTKNQLPGLVCSKQEAKAIHGLYDGDLFTGERAAKAIFLEQAGQSKLLHLATHACINEEDPMLSQIWFSDDYISNYEIFNLDLNADLAVLSACNSGSGYIAAGEGVQSLARGFFHSGCKSLVTSLWSVDDCATAEIMTSMYGYLKKGLEKDAALRMAKLDYMQNAENYYALPFYWSGFVQMGEIEKLDMSSGVEAYWKIIVGALLLIFIMRLLLKRN